jgi:hypothetical protein
MGRPIEGLSGFLFVDFLMVNQNSNPLGSLSDSNQEENALTSALRDTVEKVFFGWWTKFLAPLVRFARGDVRGHIVSQKKDHQPSYPRYRRCSGRGV